MRIKRSFTLIELIVSISITVATILTAVGIYIYILGSQEKNTAIAKLQQDAQFVLETISKDIRGYQVDYSAYSQPISQPTTVLKLTDSSGNKIYYRRNPTTCTRENPCRVEKCSKSGSCSENDFYPLTIADVNVERLDFYIQPDEDPFSGTGSYRNPTVTIVMELSSYKERFGKYQVKVQQTIIQRYQEKISY